MERGRSLLWLFLGLAFVVTLAIVVGQRLSSEAMAVVIGVIAGVAASIPTSLIVVWVTARAHLTGGNSAPLRSTPEPASHAPPAPRPAEPREPRIVVMAPPVYENPNAYSSGPHALNGYAQPASYAPAVYPPQVMLPPRRFTVVGGAEVAPEAEAGYEEVSAWER
jgi:hypothetical protein